MTQEPEQAGGEEKDDRPGKIRTWWHPLLACFLRWQLGGHYELHEEVPVGKKPLQIDLLLLRKEDGELPDSARRMLAGMVEYFNDYTLLELKSPSDTLRAGNFQTFFAYALLYRAQNYPLLDPSRLTLIVIAPRLTAPYAEELRQLSITTRQQQPGVWQLEGQTMGHPIWLLETAELAGQDHLVLTLVSPQFLRHGRQTYEELRQAGYTELVVYMAQQVQQFQRLGKEFAMQHLGSEDELVRVVRELMAGMPPEQRLEGLSVEERLKGLSPEDRLKGLSPEEVERMKELLQRRTKSDDSTNPG